MYKLNIPAPRFSYMSRGAMIGRFPVRMVGEKVCFLSRCARWVYVHANNKEEKFKRIVEIKASEGVYLKLILLLSPARPFTKLFY